ncbi:ATP-binding protein [Falsiroseomonas sp.]|uniref:ATP-binding protein n=1 Tax=Falsiroseomonas sp. TaxID=2870721 RepID=UPI003F717C4E
MTLRLAVPISLAGLEALQDGVEAWAVGQGVPAGLQLRLRLVIEELVANLVAHATWPGAAAARLECRWENDALRLVLEDTAQPFDPRETPDPAPADLADVAVGGLGLALVRRMSRELAYGRAPDGWNRTALTIRPA